MQLFSNVVLPIVIILSALFLSFQLLVKKNYDILKDLRGPTPKDPDKFCKRIGIATLVFTAAIVGELYIPSRHPTLMLAIELSTVAAYVIFYKLTDNKFG